jgi:Arc/MetJ-type ribon-helix-helix transcriptional regulator
MARVRVVVSDDQKERWNQYVETTTEYDSISDLVRKSVEGEISSEGSDDTEQVEQLDEILTEIESVKKQQSRTQDSIDAHRQNAPTLDEIQNTLMEALWEFSNTIRDLGGESDGE